MEKSKSKIIAKCSQFQIGALPGHQPQEHLFVLKSTISLYSYLDIALIFQFYDISKYFDKENLKDVMDSLYQAGIMGKIYRLWYEINKSNRIKIQTGCGMSQSAETGENLAQGSIGGALASTLNLSIGIDTLFEGSTDEVSYGSTRLGPAMFQDDLARLCTTVHGAQAGNDRIDTVMNLKQLKLNIDKSSFLLLGRKTQIEKIRNIIEKDPLLLSGEIIKEKSDEKYLGEYIHSEGLSKSIDFTVQKRYWLTLSAIMEIKTILNDYRIHVPGGINTGIMLWELAVIPMILNNADTWNDIDSVTLKKLEDLQNMLIRYLFNTPRSSPIPALCWDVGMFKIKYRILQKQLNF